MPVCESACAGIEHGQDRLAENSRFDHRACVDTDHAIGVSKGQRVGRRRSGRPRYSHPAGKTTTPVRTALARPPIPIASLRVRPDDDVGAGDLGDRLPNGSLQSIGVRIRLRALRGIRMSPSSGRAGSVAGIEAEPREESLSILPRIDIETAVIGRSACHDHALPRNPVERHRFVDLPAVPDGDGIGRLAKQRLRREIIPAVHGEKSGNAELLRGSQVLELVDADVDERRKHSDVAAEDRARPP